jgi:hypothetical protein
MQRRHGARRLIGVAADIQIPETAMPRSLSPFAATRSRARARRAAGVSLALLVVAACSGGSDGTTGGDAILSGTVRAAGSAAALADATVKIGTHEATTDANGHFELTDLPTGPATARAERPGYTALNAALTLVAGNNSHDFSLTAQEIYESGAYAIYAPAGVGQLRGVIISLGEGVNTTGFVTGGPLEPGSPVLEQSLQTLGVNLRALARSARVALLGTSIAGMANTSISDDGLFAAMNTFAGLSGHPELTGAPVLTFGLSGGCPEAGGLAERHPERAIGVLMRVPTGVSRLTSPAALAVPTFVMQSELDVLVDNLSIQSTFMDNRSRGARWALAVEPGIGHAVATESGNAANVSWIAMVMALRLPATPGAPLIALDEPSGWLGNQSTLEIAPWSDFTGVRASASWLLSSSAAVAWKSLGTRP